MPDPEKYGETRPKKRSEASDLPHGLPIRLGRRRKWTVFGA